MSKRRLPGLCLFLAATAALAADTPASPPAASGPRVVLHTSGGDLVLGLFPDVAPDTVAQLLRLVEAGVYDTSHFYRLEPGFVLQLSVAQDRTTPLTADQAALIHPIKAEFSPIKHDRGILSMARQDADPHSAETSFSILLGRAPHLDGRYTVFGKLEGGYDVLDALAASPTNALHRPLKRIDLIKAEVIGTGASESRAPGAATTARSQAAGVAK